MPPKRKLLLRTSPKQRRRDPPFNGPARLARLPARSARPAALPSPRRCTDGRVGPPAPVRPAPGSDALPGAARQPVPGKAARSALEKSPQPELPESLALCESGALMRLVRTTGLRRGGWWLGEPRASRERKAGAQPLRCGRSGTARAPLRRLAAARPDLPGFAGRRSESSRKRTTSRRFSPLKTRF